MSNKLLETTKAAWLNFYLYLNFRKDWFTEPKPKLCKLGKPSNNITMFLWQMSNLPLCVTKTTPFFSPKNRSGRGSCRFGLRTFPPEFSKNHLERSSKMWAQEVEGARGLTWGPPSNRSSGSSSGRPCVCLWYLGILHAIFMHSSCSLLAVSQLSLSCLLVVSQHSALSHQTVGA